MPNLRLLNLSGTSIKQLPSSLSKCKNLRMLSLDGCKQLVTLFPTIESCLDHLEVLSLECTPLHSLTKLSIPHKPNLKVLRFYSAFEKLEELNISVSNGGVFEEYLAPRRREKYWTAPIKKAHILVSPSEDIEKRDRSSLIKKKFPLYRSVLDQLKFNIHPRLSHAEIACNRCLEIHGGEDDVLNYNIADSICQLDLITLCNNQANTQIKLGVFTKLRNCRIERCHQMKTAFSVDVETDLVDVETELQTVSLSSLGKLRYMCSFVAGSLSHLTKIRIEYCQNIMALFTGSVVQLPVLKELEIKFCAKLKSVFDEEIASRAKGESHLPLLQRLHLCELPEMASICDGYLPTVQAFTVRGCWKLRKLPLATTVATGAPVEMVEVEGEQLWWNNVMSSPVVDKNKIKFKRLPHDSFATRRRV